jgi:maltose alpha-D-glucosyltransferase/alpha-amylase
LIPDLWYKNAVFYALDVETFMDANGDGFGDLAGLTHRLDYLRGLGVDALWLTPVQPTPNRDDGYDISDYYGIDGRLGSLGDFVELIQEARSRGIRVLVDLVVNHTSDQHPWFRQARRERGSPFHDWYVWSKKRPRDWEKGVVFPGVQKATWTYQRRVAEYYFHRFYPFEPDLNMGNPAVREEVRRILGYWLQLGVAGFRMDAVPFVLEKPTARGQNKPLCFEWLREMREFLQWRAGDAVLLGEANVPPPQQSPFFAGGYGLHLMFNFWVNQFLFYALAAGDARPLAKAIRATAKLPETAQWAHFLRNHDELDLGRLTDSQRSTVFDRFAPEPSMQLYGRGIRRRLAPMLAHRDLIELAYSAMLSLPGSPVLRYGDEIGMGDDLKQPERYPVRTPMQWSADKHGGFSTATRPVRPVVNDSVYGYETVNVERQRRDSNSLLNWTIRMIRLRKECPEIGWGHWNILPTRTPSTLAIAHHWRENTVICVHNFSGQAHSFKLRIQGQGTQPLISLIDNDSTSPDPHRAYKLTLRPYGYHWYRLNAPSRQPSTAPSVRPRRGPTRAPGRRGHPNAAAEA